MCFPKHGDSEAKNRTVMSLQLKALVDSATGFEG